MRKSTVLLGLAHLVNIELLIIGRLLLAVGVSYQVIQGNHEQRVQVSIGTPWLATREGSIAVRALHLLRLALVMTFVGDFALG